MFNILAIQEASLTSGDDSDEDSGTMLSSATVAKFETHFR